MYGNTNYGMVAKMQNMGYADTCTSSFVGIAELRAGETLKIYPNPTSSTLNIEGEQSQLQNTIIKITNNLGQVVIQNSFTNQIDVSFLPVGYYFICITISNGNVLRSKFIKD
jgi:hypothetical protein